MNKNKLNQRGFGAIGVLLVIIVVAVLGGSGWLVYKHGQTKPQAATSGSTQQATTPVVAETAQDQNIVKIPELGVQITVPDSIKDLTYQTKTVTLKNDKQATIAFFSTLSLATADKNCGTDAAPVGSLSKVSGDYPTQDEDPANELNYGQLVKQFPGFFIAAGYPQGACSKDASVNMSAGAAKLAFSSAKLTVQPIN